MAVYEKHFSPCLYIFPSISPKIGPLNVKQFLSVHTFLNNVAKPNPIKIDIIIFPKDVCSNRLKFINIYIPWIFTHSHKLYAYPWTGIVDTPKGSIGHVTSLC